MTARDFGAEEALSVGFVSKVVQGNRDEVVAAALDTARLISSKSPVAVVGTKQILLHSRDHRFVHPSHFDESKISLVLIQRHDVTSVFKTI